MVLIDRKGKEKANPVSRTDDHTLTHTNSLPRFGSWVSLHDRQKDNTRGILHAYTDTDRQKKSHTHVCLSYLY